MIGTFLSTFMTGLDRWCVKITMDTYSFAMYSFAASVVGFLAYAISPISITLYNYFCRETEKIDFEIIRKMILLFVTFIIIGAFPIKFILETFLEKYYFARTVIFVLFAGQVFYGFVKCYYVNLYKSTKKQNKYFKGILIVAMAGVIFNILLFIAFRQMISFSAGTMLAGVLWFVICTKDFPKQKNTINEIFYMVLVIALFIAYGVLFKSYIGFVLYLISWNIVSVLFMRNAFMETAKFGISMVRRKLRK